MQTAGVPAGSTLRGLCIANNTNDQGAGGIDCGDVGDPVPLVDTSLFGNSEGPGQRQFFGKCVFSGRGPACP